MQGITDNYFIVFQVGSSSFVLVNVSSQTDTLIQTRNCGCKLIQSEQTFYKFILTVCHTCVAFYLRATEQFLKLAPELPTGAFLVI